MELLLEAIDLSKIRQVFLLALAVFVLQRIIDKLAWELGQKIKKMQVILHRLQVIVRFGLYGAAIYVAIAMILRPSPEALLGLLGGTAVALGFGAREYLANLLAGLVILFEHPFRVGDRIEVEGHAGEVVDITIRSFRLRTPNDNEITVPNSVILRAGVKSITQGRLYALVEIDFYLAPEVNLEAVKEILTEAAVTSKYFCDEKPIEVLVVMERFHLRYSVLAYVTDLRQEWEFRSDVTGRAIARFQDLGVQFWVKPGAVLNITD
jgi:small-conductance mechanosensitive channel